MKSTSKKASSFHAVVPAAMLDIAELVNSAELVFMQLTNDRKTWLAGKKFASPPKRAVKFQDLVHYMVMQCIMRKADAILLGRILFDYADAQDANNLEMCYSTAYAQPGMVTLPFDVEEGDNYLKCYWLPVSSPDSETDGPAEISLQHLVNYNPYISFHTCGLLTQTPSRCFSHQQFKNGLRFFSLTSDF